MVNLLLVNETRLICNVLAAALEDEPDIKVVGCATSAAEAIQKIIHEAVDIILTSTRLPDQGALTLTQTISEMAPETKVLVLGLTEKKERVLSYVEAGAIGYVLKDASLDDLISSIRAAQDGKALISPRIAAALMERVSDYAQTFASLENSVNEKANLTPRELEVLALLGENLTNQEIAERLVIEIGTVKNHVHNILDKLNVSSRDEAAAYLAIIKE